MSRVLLNHYGVLGYLKKPLMLNLEGLLVVQEEDMIEEEKELVYYKIFLEMK